MKEDGYQRTHRLGSYGALSLLLSAVAFGCYGDIVSTNEEPMDNGDGIPVPTDLMVSCVDPAQSPGDGYHLPGSGCLACHNGTVGPPFGLGGTLYVDVDGSVPAAGVTMSIVDANDNLIDLVTTDNGNFWTVDEVAFPAVAYASSCPDLALMTTFVQHGDCNSCHGIGASIAFP